MLLERKKRQEITEQTGLPVGRRPQSLATRSRRAPRLEDDNHLGRARFRCRLRRRRAVRGHERPAGRPASARQLDAVHHASAISMIEVIVAPVPATCSAACRTLLPLVTATSRYVRSASPGLVYLTASVTRSSSVGVCITSLQALARNLNRARASFLQTSKQAPITVGPKTNATASIACHQSSACSPSSRPGLMRCG